jgi:hypothetical protein
MPNMDDTNIDGRLQELADLDPADTPDLADAIARELARRLEEQAAEREDR